MSVVSLNLSARLALLDGGRTVPVTNLLDALGDDTDDASEAVSFVCGDGGMWFTDLVDNFETSPVQ